MKLTVKGQAVERGKPAEFASTYENIEALKGQKRILAIPDTAIEFIDVTPYVLTLGFIRGESKDVLHLRPEQEYVFRHKGNAYEYIIAFALER